MFLVHRLSTAQAVILFVEPPGIRHKVYHVRFYHSAESQYMNIDCNGLWRTEMRMNKHRGTIHEILPRGRGHGLKGRESLHLAVPYVSSSNHRQYNNMSSMTIRLRRGSRRC